MNIMKKQLRESVLLCLGILCSTALVAQTVSGTVTDQETGESLIGVNVLVPRASSGTVTDFDGKYELDVTGGDTLVFRYIGFAERRIALSGRGTVDVTLAEASELLDEVVVVGYGVQRKSDVTGSMSSVDDEEITRIATSDVGQALQGKVAGVQVVPTSGAPGANAVIRIRGIGTFSNSSPLYVVDGMLTDDISFLNPNDIDRIDVLKDASASAIYGSRGANGVILITTRKGDGSGNSSISIDTYRGQQSLLRKIDLANGNEFAQLSNQLARNENRTIPFADSTNFGEGTDWQDAIFQDAAIASYQLSASGSGDRGSYLVSANHFTQDGIVKGSTFDRTTMRFNAEYKLRERVTVGQNLAFSLRRSDNGPDLLTNAYRGHPTLSFLDSLGNFAPTNPVGNPLAQLEFQNSTGRNIRTIGNAYVNYEPIDGLILRSSLGVDRSEGKAENFVPVFFVSPLQQNQDNRYSLSKDESMSWLWENTASYDFSLGGGSSDKPGPHRFNILGGITAQEFRTENLGGSVLGLAEEFPEFRFLNNGVDSTQTNFSSAGEWAMLSFLGRINYAFSDRYLVTASVRADGSSRFGRNNRYGIFPSAAVGWRVDREQFFPVNPVVNRMKLRVGYGAVGNDKIGLYPSIPIVTSGLNAVFGESETLFLGGTPVALANPDLRWETTASFNVGLELGAFDDKLTAEIDYYIKESSGILLRVPIPDYVGADPPFVNAATVQNSGVELLLTWRDKVGPVNYSLSANGATVDNEVLGLGQGQEAIEGGNVGSGRLATLSVIGQPIGSFYGFKTDGVIQTIEELGSVPTREGQQVGDLKFVDTNQDGIIDATDRVFLGSPIPDLTFGSTVSANAYGFDVSIDFYGQIGNEIYNQKRTDRFNTYNFERVYLESWTGPGTSNSEPRLTNGGGNYEVSDRFLHSGDFLRLRNITVGYTLPKTIGDKLRLQKLRVYASGTNLAIWDSYPGYSPEVISGNPLNSGIDSGVYPAPRVVNLGLQVNF